MQTSVRIDSIIAARTVIDSQIGPKTPDHLIDLFNRPIKHADIDQNRFAVPDFCEKPAVAWR